jgi:alcohol oxidase
VAFNVPFLCLSWSDFRGTCAMKPRETDGVVDKFLNVYGTENLKIAGMSLRVSGVLI